MAETQQVTFLNLSRYFPAPVFLKDGSVKLIKFYRKVVQRDIDKLASMIEELDKELNRRQGADAEQGRLF